MVMKTMALAGLVLLLSSCWMLEQPTFTWTETVTQNFNGVNYDPVQGTVTFVSGYHGRIGVTCGIAITATDGHRYAGSSFFPDVRTGESRTCALVIDTEGREMTGYRIVFDWTHN
jgi:hypothetical protein